MSSIKAIYDLRRVIELTKARLVRYPASKDLLDYIDERVDAIECEIDELQESWAQEAREHATTSARLAELAHENAELKHGINGDTSDGYHTFNELYHHRAVLFSVVVAANSSKAWKSKLHHDGTMYDGMFIVGVDTPKGQATYHYDVEPYWNMFWCRELERAPEWDGHTSDDAIERIGSLRGVVFKGPKGR